MRSSRCFCAKNHVPDNLHDAQDTLNDDPARLHGVRNKLYGARVTMYGARDALYGARVTMYGARDALYGACITMYGACITMYGARDTMYGACITRYEVRNLPYGGRDGEKRSSRIAFIKGGKLFSEAGASILSFGLPGYVPRAVYDKKRATRGFYAENNLHFPISPSNAS